MVQPGSFLWSLARRARSRDDSLRALVDAIPLAIGYIDAERRYRFVNAAYAERRRRAREDIIGRHVAEILGPARHQAIRAHLDAAFAGTRTAFDVVSSDDAGQVRHHAVQLIPDRGAAGGIHGVIVMIHDVTDEKATRAERADLLRRAHGARVEAEVARNRALFLAEVSELLASSLDYEATLRSMARVAVPTIADWCVVDVVNADGALERVAIAHVDPAKEALSLDLGRRWLLRPDGPWSVPRVIRTGTAVFQQKISDWMSEHGGRALDDMPLLRRFGLRSIVIAPLQARGRVLGAVTLMTAESGREFGPEDLALGEELGRRAALTVDNSRLYREAERRRQHAEELARLARRLTETLDARAVAERIVESVLPLFAAKSAVLRRLRPDGSLECLAVAGRDLGPSFQPGYILPAGTGLVGRVVTEGKAAWTSDIVHDASVSLTDEFRSALDAVSHRAVLAVPLHTKDEIVGALSIADSAERSYGPEDIELLQAFADQATLALSNAWLHEDVQRRRREAETARLDAEQANQAKDEFLAVLSHELRTPLTAMLGWVRMLRSGQLDPSQTGRAMEVIERNTRLQAQLINDLLDVSRIVAGKLQLDRYPVDLEAVIGAALESLRRDADAKQLRVDVLLDPRVGTIWGDPVRLNQIVVNLVSNAIKFTREGGRVEVRLERIGASARLSVMDTGVGIEPDVLPYIFDRFRQADSSHRRGHGGLGLGLAIVRQLVELHGSTVKVESAGRNRGATFVVELPVMATTAERGTIDPALSMDLPAAPPRIDGLRVLVVDDEPDARDFVRAALERSGARVSSAGSADEAFAALSRETVDVLVSDIGMPDADGYDLIRRVRDTERGRTMPAIALTAYASADDRQRAGAAGFDRHASKPIDPATLVELVSSVARVARPSEQAMKPQA